MSQIQSTLKEKDLTLVKADKGDTIVILNRTDYVDKVKEYRQHLVEKVIEYDEPVQRMSWSEAMWNYGNDKPDTRFGLRLANFKSAFENYGNDQEAVKRLISNHGRAAPQD